MSITDKNFVAYIDELEATVKRLRAALDAHVATLKADLLTLAQTLQLSSALLLECHLFKGYVGGPAQQEAVKFILRDAKILLESPSVQAVLKEK